MSEILKAPFTSVGGGDADSRSKPAPPGGDWLVDDEESKRGAAGNNWEDGDRDTGTSEWDTGTSNWQNKGDTQNSVSSNWDSSSPNTTSNNWESTDSTKTSGSGWQDEIDTGSSNWKSEKQKVSSVLFFSQVLGRHQAWFLPTVRL